jgi:hypothetical protein
MKIPLKEKDVEQSKGCRTAGNIGGDPTPISRCAAALT